MTSNPLVRVGIIGTGFGRLVHLPAFRLVDGVVVVGLAARDRERVRAVARETGVPEGFASWSDMVESAEIDAVSIATPPISHAEMALAALAAGKAVLCEKPLAMNAAEAKRMLDTARAAGVVHFVAFELREIAALQAARDLLRAGVAGSIRHVVVNWIVTSWADPKRPWSWRADRQAGGGLLGAFGAHVFDYLEWLFGPVRVIAAHLATRVPRRPDEAGRQQLVDADDCCHLMLELYDGTPVSVVLSPVASHSKGHWIEVYGERAALTIGSANPHDYAKGFGLWEGRPGASELRPVPLSINVVAGEDFPDGRIVPFARLARRFVDAIREKRLDERPSFADGTRAQLLVDLAQQAHRDRTWIQVPLPVDREFGP